MAMSGGRSQGFSENRNRYNETTGGGSIEIRPEDLLREGDWADKFTGQNSPHADLVNEDKWYWDEIEQFRNNPEWYKILSNNPYLVGNSGNFEPDLFQKILESLGDTSARTKYLNNLKAQARKWYTDQLSALHTEKYGSATNQASLERQAGLNPDLIGISQSPAGNASDEASNAMLPESNSTQGIQMIEDVGKSVVNCITTTMGLIQNIQGMKANTEGIVQSELDSISKTNNWLLNEVASNMPDNFFSKDYHNVDDFEQGLVQMLQNSLDNVRHSENFNKLSKQTRKYIAYAIDSYKRGGKLGMKTLYQNLYNNYLESKKETVDIRASKGYSDDIDEWISNLQPHLEKFFNAEEAKWEKEGIDKDIADKELDFKQYRKTKIESLDTLFKEIEDAIPNDAKWKPLGIMVTRLIKMGLVQKFFNE